MGAKLLKDRFILGGVAQKLIAVVREDLMMEKITITINAPEEKTITILVPVGTDRCNDTNIT
jgi:hypothetical protein